MGKGTGIQNRAAHCLPNGKQQKAGRGVAGRGREAQGSHNFRCATRRSFTQKKYVKFMNMNEADGDVNCDSDSDCDANVLAQLLLHKLHAVCRPRHVWATKLLRETGPNVINTSRHRRRTRL